MIDPIKRYLAAHETEMFALLERIVSINSHTPNIDGVNRVADVFQEVFQEMDLAIRRMPTEHTGDNLVAENRFRARHGGGVLLVGHMDTVYPPEMGFNSFRREGDKVYGPGVADMKGGLVAATFAIRALQATGFEKIPAGLFFNADEETGSPYSRNLIVDEAKRGVACFVMEASPEGGQIITSRKGRIVFDLQVGGHPFHAGHAPFPKPSAIVEIAHKITAMEALNDPAAGTSFNAGYVEGGVGPNTVAAMATARCEVRFTTPEAGEAAWAAIERIAATPTLADTTGKVVIRVQRPPLVTDETVLGLYQSIEDAAEEIGMDVTPIAMGGGSDANIVSAAGIPAIDGMGPAGGSIHTPEEFMHAETMISHALLTAVGIVKAVEKYS